jgi:hypothetical protein
MTIGWTSTEPHHGLPSELNKFVGSEETHLQGEK